jgi:hypothetical protein
MQGAQHAGPGPRQHQQAAALLDLAAFLVHQRGGHAGQRAVAEPGLAAVMPGSGEIMIAPVSVCHQVSTIGQRSPPITL